MRKFATVSSQTREKIRIAGGDYIKIVEILSWVLDDTKTTIVEDHLINLEKHIFIDAYGALFLVD